MHQGFRAKRHFERFQNARRISAVKKVFDFFDKLNRTAAHLRQSGKVIYICNYFSTTSIATGLWSEFSKPRSMHSTFFSSTFGERMKPSIT